MNTLAIYNPANGQLITTLPADDATSVATKTAAARVAQPAWAATPMAERKACIERFRSGVVRDLESLAVTLTRETGKPVKMSRNELNGLLGRIDFFLKEIELAVATETVFDDGGMREQIQHTPLGVVANISAWNYPWFVGCNVIVPALLTGNAVVYKPSEYATMTGLEIARLLHEAGVPREVMVCLVGAGAVGAALLEQPVDGVFFTGSVATGQRIALAVGNKFIKLQLELGGKDPTYVCEDADPKAAAESLADGAMYNTGQSCCSVERIYVHEKIHDAFVAAFVDSVQAFRTGDPMARGHLHRRDHACATAGHSRRTGGRRFGQGRAPAGRRQTRQRPVRWCRQLVRAHGVGQRQPQHGAHAGGELWPHHRHPESQRRCRGREAHERHALRPHRRGLHARPGARAAAAGTGQCGQRLLELLRPCEPPAALERPR
jgi:acyl-CoA reductase-like NAD-dependent aldehyde dehydrogenase